MTSTFLAIDGPLLPVVACPPSRPLVEECVSGVVGTPSRSPLPARNYFPAAQVRVIARYTPMVGPLSARPQFTLLDAVQEWAAYWDQCSDV